MRISSQRKIGQIFECLQPASGIKLTGPGVATKHLRKLDIEEMGCVKDFIGIENSFGQLNSGGRIQQHFDHGRSINHNHRPSRSDLTDLAGETAAG